MKKIFQFASLLLLLNYCSFQREKVTADQVFGSGRSYLNAKLGDKEILDNRAFVMFTTPDSLSYILKKADIVIGDLNNDGAQDAIISYVVVLKNKSFFTKQVIFFNDKGVLKAQKEFQMGIFIKKIEEEVIFAEKSKIASDSPNFGCHSCMEKIKLRFENDTLIQNTN